MINLTDSADIHLSSIINENDAPSIRLAVNSGGCSGFTYDWQLVKEEEILTEREGHVNISHKSTPSWEEHVKFIESKIKIFYKNFL